MSCTYTYTSDGKLRCLENMGYDISVIISDETTTDILIEKSLANTPAPPRKTMKEILRFGPPASSQVKHVKVSIVDSTNYKDLNKPTLKLFIQDLGDLYVKPINVVFSNTVPLSNYFNRTANVEIPYYRGLIFYITT
jgi:hypothetical protein